MSSKSPTVRVVVFCSHSIHDPLVSTLTLDYLLRLQEGKPDVDRRILLFTEEPAKQPLAVELSERLRLAGIRWVPVPYRLNGAQWWQKLRNLFVQLLVTIGFLGFAKRRVLMGALAYGGIYTTMLGALGLGRRVVLCFEPHSRYMVEMGIWKADGPKARVVGALERWQMRSVDNIVVPTLAVEELVARHRPKAGVVLQGITIDVPAAAFDPAARTELRERYQLADKLVLFYVGKFGGIYHTPGQYLRFLERMCAADQRVYGMVVAGHTDLAALKAEPAYARLADRMLLHPAVPPHELPRYLSAADIGVLAIPPTPAQVYRTPVKTAHYWAAGLPVLTPEGIGDDADIARTTRTGIVVSDLPDVDAQAVLAAYEELHKDGAQTLRARCVQVAMAERDTGHIVRILGDLLV